MEDQPAFIFAPFESEDRPSKVLYYDEILTDEAIVQLGLQLPSVDKSVPMVLSNKITSTPKTTFIDMVEGMQHQIEKGICKKIVASKVSVETQEKSPVALFLKLCDNYPHAFTYMIYVAGECLWMGATPEVLLTCAEKQVETMSLAGTQPSILNQLVYQWGEKEREEQQIVTDYIAAILSSIALQNISISTPETFSAGNLVHLKSTLKAMVSSTAQLKELLLKLHPTPAVGGLPKDEAMQIILKEEAHQRQYYTGFLGLWNGAINTSLYVNLRCAEIIDDQIIYYAGCGITSNSDAEKEWQETEHKIETLHRVYLSL
jgi:isochorismate synthase